MPCPISGVRMKAVNMQGQSEHEVQLTNSGTDPDGRSLLLEKVKFKWLMAGIGFWIDMSRFQSDSSYASRFMELAETSDSAALRDCAASLQRHNNSH